MKQQLISELQNRLLALHIHADTSSTTDLSIMEEFLDAGFSTGKKKITYEASIFADETSSTIFMFELTKEVGSGFSFGSSSESFSQSGTTLFRKVKSIQYSPDGKAYEYSLDLGAIPKTVKEVASTYNWKFKTVITKAKASYPAEYLKVPSSLKVPSGNSSPADSQNNAPAPAESNYIFCSNCGTKLDSQAAFCKSCGQSLSSGKHTTASAPAPASPTTAIPEKKKSKGCLIALIVGILGVLGVIAIIFVAFVAMALVKDEDISYSSANVSEACMASQIDPDTFEPLDDVSNFSQEDTILYATAYIKNAPEGTSASSIWYYLPTGESMASENDVTIDTDGWIEFELSSDTGFSAGDYKVEILLNDEVAETLTFSIE